MNGMELITAERQRQIEEEGWDAQHDDIWTGGELEKAAECYWHKGGSKTVPVGWPWSVQAWKPKERLRNLVRAGALLLAEKDRLGRAGEHARHQHLDAMIGEIAEEMDILLAEVQPI